MMFLSRWVARFHLREIRLCIIMQKEKMDAANGALAESWALAVNIIQK